MEIEEAKVCMQERIPVIINQSYHFFDTPTYIIKVNENGTFHTVEVEGSNDHYEIWRVEKYKDTFTRLFERIQNTMLSITPSGLLAIYKKQINTDIEGIKIDLDDVLEDINNAMKENNQAEIISLKNEASELVQELQECEKEIQEMVLKIKELEDSL